MKKEDRPNLMRFKNFSITTDPILSKHYKETHQYKNADGVKKLQRGILLGMYEIEGYRCRRR